MTFDWPAFLEAHRIEVVQQTSKNVYIPCPFCGPEDRGAHMGMSTMSSAWGCWRDSDHCGRKPERLIVALLKCSWATAREIVGSTVIEPGDFASLGARLEALGRTPSQAAVVEQRWPPELRPVALARNAEGALAYLRGRGFPGRHAERLAQVYGLRTAVAGRWAWRIVCPFTLDGTLVGWTGRAVGRASLRYLSHPDGSVVGRTLYLGDEARAGGRALVVVEGPFDALKLDYYGRAHGLHAVGLLGLRITDAKAARILELAREFERLYVMLDLGAAGQARNVMGHLRAGNPREHALPSGREDPGEMTAAEVRKLAEEC